MSCQLLVKGQYNVVGKYDYHWSQRMSGQSGYNNKLTDDESLEYKLKPFFSLEPAIALLIKTEKRGYFKFQVGCHFWQKTLQHTYIYNDQGEAGNMRVEKTQLHPVSLPINFTISHIFYRKKN